MDKKLAEGQNLFNEGKFDEAEKCFLSIIEEDSNSNNKIAYNNIGVVAYQKNEFEKAVDYFSRSLKYDPFYKDAILNIADLLKLFNESHTAIPYLEKIAAINPSLN